MPKVFRTLIQKRFDDFDVFAHANNVHQQQYFDVGKSEFFESMLSPEVFIEPLRVMIVSTKSDFLDQIRSTDTIYVETRLLGIGNKSITIEQSIVTEADGVTKVCTRSESTLVAWNFDLQLAVPIPDKWREALTK